MNPSTDRTAATDQSAAQERPGSAAAGPGEATDGPGLIEALRQVLDNGAGVATASRSTFGALIQLASAELALARTAALRGIVTAAAALVVAWVALLFGLATVASLLAAAGLGWTAALGVCALAAILLLAALAWLAMRLFGLTRMERTRRRIGELRGQFG